ncbi:MAG: hypothetical protein NTU44_20560 [Bacteroidetes bacterium]|nr:hypothetical protein [Bacteroidota bacterium]
MEKRLNLVVFLFVSILFLSCSRSTTNIRKGEPLIIYPPPPDTTRVQFLTSISNSLDISGQRNGLARFVLGNYDPLPIVKPYGLATIKGRIVVCDAGVGGLEIIDLQNQRFEYFIPKGKGQLKTPANCCADTSGTVYVADGGRRQIVIFDKNGQYIDAFGESTNGKITDVAVTEDKIWVPDASRGKINVFQKDTKKLLFSFPDSLDEGEGHLFQPINICIANDLVYVTDFGDFKIKSYNLKGQFQTSFGSYGNRLGQFTRPKGIAADRDANLFAVDAAFENVQIFNKEGKLLMFFGGPYKGPGDMWLPAKVVVDYNNLDYFRKFVDPGFRLKYLIMVTNQYGPGKINIYGAVEAKK